MRRIVLGISGSSGAIYAARIMYKLANMVDAWDRVDVVMSSNGLKNWELEIGDFDKSKYPFDFYDRTDFHAPFASGSAQYDTMIVCPCSMGTLGRLASGISDDLMTRAGDVILKERRKLILVPRETPLSLIHLRNMVQLTEAGAIMVPAIPSFYTSPTSMDDVADTVVDRVLDLAGLPVNSKRWGST